MTAYSGAARCDGKTSGGFEAGLREFNGTPLLAAGQLHQSANGRWGRSLTLLSREQHEILASILSAAALNLIRTDAWLNGTPSAPPESRTSPASTSQRDPGQNITKCPSPTES